MDKGQKYVRLGLILFAILVAAFVYSTTAHSQEIRTNVTLTISDSNAAFTASILNGSTAPRSIVSVRWTLNSPIVFDTFGTAAPAVTFAPAIGANNDGQSNSVVTMTFTSPLLPGQQWSSSGGDIDTAAPSVVNVLITYDDGTIVDRSLTQTGSVWNVVIQIPTTPIPTGSATLTWVGPTTNTDGTPYTNRGGFKIYYGTMQGTYANSVTINDPNATSRVIDMLPYGQWYFVATAFNTAMAESGYSNVAGVVVQQKPDIPQLGAGAMVVGNEGIAYAIFQSLNDGRLVPVGYVPAGTPCNGDIGFRDPTQRVMYAVPKASVDFEGDADAELVFAICTD